MIELLVASGITALIALAAATMQSHQAQNNRVEAGRASKVSLADAVRTQLSRRASCAPSMVVKPTNFSGPNEIAVVLGTGAGVDRVQAGNELPKFNLRVTSLQVRDAALYGTTTSGNTVYTGNVFLRTESGKLNSGQRVGFKEELVSRLTFEVSGGALVACYAGDAYADASQQLRSLCATITSPDGVPGMLDANGRCIVKDAEPSTKCGQLGGNWVNGRCSFVPRTIAVGRGVDFGSVPGVWYGASCPAGGRATGGTCHSGSGPAPHLNGLLTETAFYCGWDPDPQYSNTQYNIYVVCFY